MRMRKTVVRPGLVASLVSLLWLTTGCGGNSGNNNTQPPPPSPTIAVSPTSASVRVGQTQTFSLTVTGNPTVTCSVNGPGSCSVSGTTSASYTGAAPASGGDWKATLTLTAANAGGQATASVTIALGQITGVTLTPASAVITAAQTQKFTATVQGSGTFDNTVTWSASAGTIDNVGNYTPPLDVTGSLAATVTARSLADPTQSSSAAVTVTFNHLTYQQAPEVDGQAVNDQGTAVAVTPHGTLRVMADAPVIPDSSNTTCGLLLYDSTHKLLDSWSNSPTPCLINQMALGPDGTTVYAAGWQQTDINNTATRSAMVWQVGLASDTLNVLALADFQLPTTGPGMHTEAKTINVQSGLLYVGTNSDYRVTCCTQGGSAPWYSGGGWMVVLTAANGVQQTYFEVSSYDPDINLTNLVTGIALFVDHLWAIDTGYENGNPIHGYVMGPYSLTGTHLFPGEVAIGNPDYNCQLFQNGIGEVLRGCTAYFSATNQAFTIAGNPDSDFTDNLRYTWWGDNGNNANAPSVNLATSSILNSSNPPGLTMAGSCSRLGSADLTKTDACAADFSGASPVSVSWTMRFDQSHTPGGSLFGWNGIASYADEQGVLHLVFVGVGSDGVTSCGTTLCTQAVIGDYTPPQ